MNMPRLLPFLALSLLVLRASLFPATPPFDEARLPLSARLVEPVDLGAPHGVLAAGTPFVLIRIEGERVVADVSRRGVFRLPLASTDVAALTVAATAGAEGRPPEMSRMAAFIGNKLLGGDSGWRRRLPLERALPFRRWIFLYVDASAGEPTAAAVRAAAQAYDAWSPEERAHTALILVETSGDADAIARIAEVHRPAFQAMPGYLARGYVRSLLHLEKPAAPPLFVATSSAGTVLARHEGAAPPGDFWLGARAVSSR